MPKILYQCMRRIRSQDSERGAAIVAAIGVMIICISLGVLVVSQAINSQRDSGRNRARAVEIHTAEAGVDMIHAKLQKGIFPCAWTMTSEGSGDFSLGPDQVGAQATIEYWDENGNPMSCVDEKLAFDDDSRPARARILVTSKNQRDTLAGIEPKRSFESEVLLKPEQGEAASAAIFSGGNFQGPATGYLRGEGADIWIDNENYRCHQNMTISGSLYLPRGGAELSKSCGVDKNIFARDDVTLKGSTQVGGRISIKVGNLALTNTEVTVGRGAFIGGRIVQNEGTINGPIEEGATLTDFPVSKGLPPVENMPGDWENPALWTGGAGPFQPWGVPHARYPEKYNELLSETVVRNSAPDWVPINQGDFCGQLDYRNWSLNGPLQLPEHARVLDATKCEKVEIVDLQIVVNADTVIFAKNFDINPNAEFISGDGDRYNLWLIVPYEFKGHRCGFKAHGTFSTSLNTFIYAPCETVFTGAEFNGNIYGDPVTLHSDLKMDSGNMIIPGVNLMPGYANMEPEWSVDVIYKRETGDRVGVN